MKNQNAGINWDAVISVALNVTNLAGRLLPLFVYDSNGAPSNRSENTASLVVNGMRFDYISSEYDGWRVVASNFNDYEMSLLITEANASGNSSANYFLGSGNAKQDITSDILNFPNGVITVSPMEIPGGSDVNQLGGVPALILAASVATLAIGSTLTITGGFTVFADRTASGVRFGITARNLPPTKAAANITLKDPVTGLDVSLNGSFERSSVTKGIYDDQPVIFEWDLPVLIPNFTTLESINIQLNVDQDYMKKFRELHEKK